MSALNKSTLLAAALAFGALLGSGLGASAQTDSPDARDAYGSNGRALRHATVQHPHRAAVRSPRMSYNDRRPLTVRSVRGPVVVAAPQVNTGPGTIVTGPLSFGSNVASLPFRGLNAIFPASGDLATNPLVLIGAPLHAIGDIVQVPFRIVGAPFGGTTIATY